MKTPAIKIISRATVGEVLQELASFHPLGFKRRAMCGERERRPLVVDICCIGGTLGEPGSKGVYGV